MATPFSNEVKHEPGISGKVLLIAAAAVVLLAAIAAVATLHRAPAAASANADSYAANVTVSGIELSEATNGAGGKVTYIDGTLRNSGAQTLRAATAQVTFGTDDGTSTPPQIVPVTLVRTREPYVDLEPVSAEPLPPGSAHAFRLIFETVPAAWNQREPSIRIVHTDAH